ncbi:hypothetical protein [Micromonospora sp. MA102]|uniref:hypothetical protein n=1 Tax=Micromonospora sp. MA102 TaxID=2952755 RepID=UPI0021C7A0AD|nr:hypothetical protein [Micromonospora sp. MA102]
MMIGAEQAAPAAGHQRIAEDPVAYVLVVLGGDGGPARFGLRQDEQPAADLQMG